MAKSGGCLCGEPFFLQMISGLRRPKNVKFDTKVASSARMCVLIMAKFEEQI